MPLVCPICKSPAQQLPNLGAAIAYRCVIHHHFKVADAVWQDAEEYTREQWEIAFRKAKQSDFSSRFPFIAMAVGKLSVSSRLIDGEAIVCDEHGRIGSR